MRLAVRSDSVLRIACSVGLVFQGDEQLQKGVSELRSRISSTRLANCLNARDQKTRVISPVPA
jgi:hypothetical protein